MSEPTDDTSCHHRTIALAPVEHWGRGVHWLCTTCGARVDCEAGQNHARQTQRSDGWVCTDCGRMLLPPPMVVPSRRPHQM